VHQFRAIRLHRGAPIAILPTLLAGGLCAIGLGSRSVSLDESATATIVTQHGAALGRAIAHDGGNMAGYYALLHLLTGLAGHGTVLLRAPSLIAAALSAGVLARLGERLFGAGVGLAGGLLAAVSLPLVFWGQSARGYAPMLLFVTLSFLALAAVLDARPSEPVPRRALAAYAMGIVLACYMGLLAVLVVPGQLAVLAWRRRRIGAVLAALGVAALACLPLGLLAAGRGSGQLAWLAGPTLTTVAQALEALASAGLAPNFHATAVLVPVSLAALGALAAGLGLAARALRRPDARTGAWPVVLVLLWLLVPVLAVLVESLVGQPLLVARNLLMALPAVSLLIAWAAFALGPAPIGWALVAAMLALRAVPVAAAVGVSPEDWRAATATVLAGSPPGTCVAFYPSDARMPFRYYARARARPRSVLPAVPWSVSHPYVEDYRTLSPTALSRLPARCPILWLVAGHRGEPHGSPTSRANYRRYLQLRAELGARYRPGTQLRFGYAPAVEVQRFTAAE
jgi:mannosyltransferase